MKVALTFFIAFFALFIVITIVVVESKAYHDYDSQGIGFSNGDVQPQINTATLAASSEIADKFVSATDSSQ